MPSPAASSRIHVRIQHANAFVARGLAVALAGQSDIQVVEEDAPQVVVADYAAGVSLSRARQTVLILGDGDQAQEVRDAMAAGVDGYLSLYCAVDDVLAGIRQLARGARILGPGAARHLARDPRQQVLTRRQVEVLALVARGERNKVIARRLHITDGTVKSHMKAILQKLGARSRTHALRIALEQALVAPAPQVAGGGSDSSRSRSTPLTSAPKMSVVPLA